MSYLSPLNAFWSVCAALVVLVMLFIQLTTDFARMNRIPWVLCIVGMLPLVFLSIVGRASAPLMERYATEWMAGMLLTAALAVFNLGVIVIKLCRSLNERSLERAAREGISIPPGPNTKPFNPPKRA